MVNSVVTGGVEYQLQRAEVGHQLSVDPELVEQVQLLVDQRLAGGDEEGQGEVERLEISTINITVRFFIILGFLPRCQSSGKLTV